MSKELYQISLSSDILQYSLIYTANDCCIFYNKTDDGRVFVNLSKRRISNTFTHYVNEYVKLSKANGKKYLILSTCLSNHHFTKTKQPNLFDGITTKYVINEENIVFDHLKLESLFIKTLNKLEDFEDVFVIKDLSLSEYDLYKILTSNEIISNSFKETDKFVDVKNVKSTVNGNFNIPNYLKEKVENNLKKFGVI